MLTVSGLARRAGVTPDTVRYYEQRGLLPADRSPAGYRLFDDGAVGRLAFIRRAQRFGLSLDEIAQVLAIRDEGRCPCGHTGELLQRRLAEVERQLTELEALRAELRTLLDGEQAPVCHHLDDHDHGGVR